MCEGMNEFVMEIDRWGVITISGAIIAVVGLYIPWATFTGFASY